jgi:hypothetical protein
MASKHREVLAHWFPRLGFLWKQNPGPPRFLSRKDRDATVQWAIIEICRHILHVFSTRIAFAAQTRC